MSPTRPPSAHVALTYAVALGQAEEWRRAAAGYHSADPRAAEWFAWWVAMARRCGEALEGEGG